VWKEKTRVLCSSFLHIKLFQALFGRKRISVFHSRKAKSQVASKEAKIREENQETKTGKQVCKRRNEESTPLPL
jgi:hypothetical protein